MTTYAVKPLSGSTDFRGVKVAATATPGTSLHVAGAVTGDNNLDVVNLEAVNTDTVARKLTIEWGGTTAPDDLTEITLPPESGRIPVVDSGRIRNGLTIRAFAETANVVIVFGHVLAVRA